MNHFKAGFIGGLLLVAGSFAYAAGEGSHEAAWPYVGGGSGSAPSFSGAGNPTSGTNCPSIGSTYLNTTDGSLWRCTVPTPTNTWVNTGSTVSDATTGTKGVVQLSGDLTGSATSPQIGTGVITNTDINASAGIDPTKLGAGTVDAFELDYLDNVITNVQTQLNLKVSGPNAAVDNAITRYNSTTGKLVQDSPCTVSDIGVLDCPAESVNGGKLVLKEGTTFGTDTATFAAPNTGLTASPTHTLTDTGLLPSSATAYTPTTVGDWPNFTASTIQAAFDYVADRIKYDAVVDITNSSNPCADIQDAIGPSLTGGTCRKILLTGSGAFNETHTHDIVPGEVSACVVIAPADYLENNYPNILPPAKLFGTGAPVDGTTDCTTLHTVYTDTSVVEASSLKSYVCTSTTADTWVGMKAYLSGGFSDECLNIDFKEKFRLRFESDSGGGQTKRIIGWMEGKNYFNGTGDALVVTSFGTVDPRGTVDPVVLPIPCSSTSEVYLRTGNGNGDRYRCTNPATDTWTLFSGGDRSGDGGLNNNYLIKTGHAILEASTAFPSMQGTSDPTTGTDCTFLGATYRNNAAASNAQSLWRCTDVTANTWVPSPWVPGRVNALPLVGPEWAPTSFIAYWENGVFRHSNVGFTFDLMGADDPVTVGYLHHPGWIVDQYSWVVKGFGTGVQMYGNTVGNFYGGNIESNLVGIAASDPINGVNVPYHPDCLRCITPYTGTATSATDLTVTVSGESWTTDQWLGKWIYIHSGPGAGLLRIIISNTADTITWADAANTYNTLPAAGSIFTLMDNSARPWGQSTDGKMFNGTVIEGNPYGEVHAWKGFDLTFIDAYFEQGTIYNYPLLFAGGRCSNTTTSVTRRALGCADDGDCTGGTCDAYRSESNATNRVYMTDMSMTSLQGSAYYPSPALGVNATFATSYDLSFNYFSIQNTKLSPPYRGTCTGGSRAGLFCTSDATTCPSGTCQTFLTRPFLNVPATSQVPIDFSTSQIIITGASGNQVYNTPLTAGRVKGPNERKYLLSPIDITYADATYGLAAGRCVGAGGFGDCSTGATSFAVDQLTRVERFKVSVQGALLPTTFGCKIEAVKIDSSGIVTSISTADDVALGIAALDARGESDMAIVDLPVDNLLNAGEAFGIRFSAPDTGECVAGSGCACTAASAGSGSITIEVLTHGQ